ncbi:uncharacterized protein LOC124147197 isoform X1 [Haliotis rufescens]|uniref:uncharacterized protein LOC124147197 isoform X1 n=1 Tax=Haliotis rufescens TaxID=6454 RepID=UPI00201F0AA7|nr:uncharacterized protein LOC124147197 isoform X1 [Haliotis rufescens]
MRSIDGKRQTDTTPMDIMSTSSKLGLFSFGEFIMKNSKRATEKHNGKECKRNVIICSEEKVLAAEDLSKRVGQKEGQHDIIKCKDREMFDPERLPFASFSTMYLLVDTGVASLILRKGRLHNSVYDYFEGLEASGKRVFVVNKFEEKNRMFNEVLYQLPGDCTKEMKDLTITCVPRHKPQLSQSESEPSWDSDDDMQTEGELPSESLGKATTEGTEDAYQLNPDALLNEGSVPDHEDLNCQIGSHCTMNIKKSSNQIVIAKQDGTENTINVNVVPGPSASKTLLVITTDPHNPELEKLLVHEIDAKKDVINIRLRSSDAQIVTVRAGSVVIEIDVDPGRALGHEWLESVVKDVFDGDLKSLIPEGTTLNMDVQSSLVVPIKSLGKLGDFVLANPENLHKNCVPSRKYEEKVKEVESLNKALLETKTSKKTPVPFQDMKTTISAGMLETVLEASINTGVKSDSGKFDPIDIAVSCVELIGQLSGQELWDYVIMHPLYFAADGPFYNQMKRDVGLEHDKHCRLPSFPDKTFFYNAKCDCLELCIDPHGHFSIGPDIAQRVNMDKITTAEEKLNVGKMDVKAMDVRPKVYRTKRETYGTRGKSTSKTGKGPVVA